MFGLFSKKKKAEAHKQKGLMQAQDRGWFTIFESYPGAWQQGVKVDHSTLLSFYAIFGCITLIASDISKLRIRMVRNKDGIWTEVPLGKYKVLERPNSTQNRMQFVESWINSKLSRGNTYVLKERNSGGDVVGLYVLSPDLVKTLVSDTGEVFYQLNPDNVTGIVKDVTVPASEIIHDRFNCLFHPLVGLSPIYASALSAAQGLNIQENSKLLFQNMSRPNGILTTPSEISKESAERIKSQWEENYGGKNIGRTAVLGNDMKYIQIGIDPVDTQLVEQLKVSAETVCSSFHVPKHKIVGDPPSYNNIEALDQQYYSQCLQSLIEAMELCLDIGLGVDDSLGTEFDLDGLLRMDTATQIKTLGEAVKSALMTPNEARRKINLKPISGGDTVYLQQQMYSLDALAKRDASDDPFGKSAPPAAPSAAEDTPQEDDPVGKALALLEQRAPEELIHVA